MGKTIDMAGEVYGRLQVLYKVNTKDATRSTFWKCKCDCGNTKEVSRQNLIKGFVKSCGCLQTESRIKHNNSHHILYNVWVGLRRRCNDEKHPTYKDYGARGIKVCKRWEENFQNFLDDMGERPDGTWDIDRKDNNKGYNKDNCRWVKKSVNAQNKRNSKRWIVNGIEYQSQNEASKKTGISSSQINRMCKGYTRSNGKYYPPHENCSFYYYYSEVE